MTPALGPGPVTVGYRALDVADEVQGTRVAAHALYPAHLTPQAPARRVPFGPYHVDVAVAAPIAAAAGARLPVVLVSHGQTGSPWTHRDLAARLARAGWAVILVEHPGDSRADTRLTGTAANLANRPRHLRLALDAALADRHLGAHLDVGAIAALGHSLGGYAVLALAGGRPTSAPHQHEDGRPRPVPVEPDPRVRALVLLAPATPWLSIPGALAGVTAPILLLTGEHDAITPAVHAQVVLRGVPDPARVTHRIVPGAGHFSFQSPFPAAMIRPDFAPAHDPPGFDRAAFQGALAAEVEAFLARALAPAR